MSSSRPREVLITNARIGKVEMNDLTNWTYALRLTDDIIETFRQLDLSINIENDQDGSFVRVNPLYRGIHGRVIREIPDNIESLFLEKEDIDITFRISEIVTADNSVIHLLYFNPLRLT